MIYFATLLLIFPCVNVRSQGLTETCLCDRWRPVSEAGQD